MTELQKNRLFLVTAGLILILALVLRVIAADGDLGQDEITSLNVATHVARFDQIFWKVNFDNNHPLNTAWLYLVGGHASFLAMRALSIVTGTVAVAAAGLWGLRQGRFAALSAMLLLATSYLMVHYSSEARGYSGLSLCIVLATIEVERLTEGKGRKAFLTLWALTGCLFHLDMCFALGMLALACLWVFWRRTGNIARALDTTFAIFKWPAASAFAVVLPMLLHPYTIGVITPFALGWFLKAYDLSLETSLNLPLPALAYADVILAAALTLACLAWKQRGFAAAFCICAIVVLPVTIALVKIPNTNFPRHMITSDIAFVMVFCSIGALLWRKNPYTRAAMGIILAASIAGNGFFLEKFFRIGRDHYEDAVARMTGEGPTTYGLASPADLVVDFYSQRLDRPSPRFVPLAEWCAAGPPEWFIFSTVMTQTLPPERIAWGPAGCSAEYDRQAIYPAWGLSGGNWVLYRRGRGG